MKGLLKCLGMLVKKKKKKERLFLSPCETKETELLFQKNIYQVWNSNVY